MLDFKNICTCLEEEGFSLGIQPDEDSMQWTRLYFPHIVYPLSAFLAVKDKCTLEIEVDLREHVPYTHENYVNNHTRGDILDEPYANELMLYLLNKNMDNFNNATFFMSGTHSIKYVHPNLAYNIDQATLIKTINSLKKQSILLILTINNILEDGKLNSRSIVSQIETLEENNQEMTTCTRAKERPRGI